METVILVFLFFYSFERFVRAVQNLKTTPDVGCEILETVFTIGYVVMMIVFVLMIGEIRNVP